MTTLHFWYSDTQAEIYTRNRHISKNYAIIDGEEVVYTMCSVAFKQPSIASDAMYLGRGSYSRMSGSW